MKYLVVFSLLLAFSCKGNEEARNAAISYSQEICKMQKFKKTYDSLQRYTDNEKNSIDDRIRIGYAMTPLAKSLDSAAAAHKKLDNANFAKYQMPYKEELGKIGKLTCAEFANLKK